jgi:hypothetical protein
LALFPWSSCSWTQGASRASNKLAPGGYAREEQEAEISNGGGGGEKELVNSKDPHYPFIYFF